MYKQTHFTIKHIEILGLCVAIIETFRTEVPTCTHLYANPSDESFGVCAMRDVLTLGEDVLFCILAVLDLMDVLCPFISVLCHFV